MGAVGEGDRQWREKHPETEHQRQVKNQRDRDEESEVRVDPSLSYLQASMLGWGLVIAQATVS